MKKFSSFTLKITAFAAVLLTVVISMAYTGSVLFSFNDAETENAFNENSGKKVRTVIIDPGHGGIDGGAVSTVNGALEKDINLSVALSCADLLRAGGIEVILTRTEDILLFDENTKGTKKSQDLKNRLAFTVNNPDSLLLSIHMNTFPREQYSGMQVFYSPNNEDSEKIASDICVMNKTYLQPDNDREIKRANSNIYLLWRTKVPAVLVECGFLSNPKEAGLLVTEEYQKKLAAVMYAAVMNYLNEE